MLLQELFNEENNHLKNAYTIELDSDSSNVDFSMPPTNLEEIGFVFKADNDGLMDESLMDIVISYRLANLDVVLEVPAHLVYEKKVTAKYLIQLASNVDFAISLLPPKHQLVSEGYTSEQYQETVLEFLDEILARPNFDKFIYPISNFLEYLMLEQVIGSEKLQDFRPEQKYLVDNYASVMSKEESDSFKQQIREKLYAFYGDKENFELVAKSILESVVDKSADFFEKYVERSAGNWYLLI